MERSADVERFEAIIPARGKRYTQSIELWDQAPKAILGPVIDPMTERAVPQGARHLPIQVRRFVHYEPMVVEVAPARLRDRKGIERDWLPGLREIMVEHAIRKISLGRKLIKGIP